MSITIQTREKRGIIVGRNRKQVLVHSRTKTVVRTNTRQGVAGPPSDKNYTHDQMVASTVWMINHALGKYPSVMIVNSAGEVVEGFIQHVDNMQVVVTFTSAFAGKAYLN